MDRGYYLCIARILYAAKVARASSDEEVSGGVTEERMDGWAALRA